MEPFLRNKRIILLSAVPDHTEKVMLADFIEVLLCELLADAEDVRYPHAMEDYACRRAVRACDHGIDFAALSEVAVDDISDLLREFEEGHLGGRSRGGRHREGDETFKRGAVLNVRCWCM